MPYPGSDQRRSSKAFGGNDAQVARRSIVLRLGGRAALIAIFMAVAVGRKGGRYRPDDEGFTRSAIGAQQIPSHLEAQQVPTGRYSSEGRIRWPVDAKIWIPTIVAIVACIVSAVSAWQSLRQNEIAESVQRPWIKIDGVTGVQLIVTKEAVRIEYVLNLSNIGSEPARVIVDDPDEPKVYLGEDVRIDYLQQFCEQRSADADQTPAAYLGSVLFPRESQAEEGGSAERPLKAIFSVTDRFESVMSDFIRQHRANAKISPDMLERVTRQVNFILGGCVSYRSAARKGKIFYTSYAFVLKNAQASPTPVEDVVIGQGFDLTEPGKYAVPKDIVVHKLMNQTYAR